MSRGDIILAGDIGATNSRLALFEECENERLEIRSQRTYASAEYESFGTVAMTFLEEEKAEAVSACFGIPGPVFHGKVKTTNIPWTLCQETLQKELGCRSVVLINDLAAIACSVPLLKEEHKKEIYPGNKDRDRDIYAVIAPGTGLGQAAVEIVGDELIPLGSEGGHLDFGPRNEEELELVRFLLKRYDRVSVERVACGAGLKNIFDFLIDRSCVKVPQELLRELESGDFGAVIGRRALEGRDSLCVKTIEMFADAVGSHAGNMALTYLCTGGIYLAGGIAPKLEKFFTSRRFLKAYLSKGRLSPIAEATPLYLILDNEAGMKGAADVARRALVKIRNAP